VSTPLAVTLAALAGAALVLVVGAIVLEVSPEARRRATSAGGPCGSAAAITSDETARRQAQLVEQNSELKRALLAALARSSECDDKPARPPEPQMPLQDPTLEPDPEAASPDEIVAQEKAQVVTLEREMSEEPVDPVWAPNTERATAQVIAAATTLHLEEVKCRESLCRVKVTHRDPSRRDEDIETLLGTTPGGGQARVYAPPGDRTTVMYFSRKGMLLSALSPPVPWVTPPPVDAVDGEAPSPAPLAN
jgi:hypothetical protein